MIRTDRDRRLLRDMALSHALSRDQIIDLGYFSSVTRANSRLRELRKAGLIRVLETPFFGQFLYAATPKAQDFVGERIGRLIASRSGSPRFLQHALAVTSVRSTLLARGACDWRFEQQLRTGFCFLGRDWEVRPDGLVFIKDQPTVLEVDLGHVAPSKFADKLRSYDAFIASGECRPRWRFESFSVLTITTGPIRAKRLTHLVPNQSRFPFTCLTFERLGVRSVGAWS
ncbi:MAG: replication-relaxation family protein [Fimbriimonadaceae bacterium]